jgi:hypothetical protein
MANSDPPFDFHPPHQQWHSSPYNAGFEDKVLAALGKLEADTKLQHKLEFQVNQLVNALNQTEEEELWSQSEDNSPNYMIDENASSSSYYELMRPTSTECEDN